MRRLARHLFFIGLLIGVISQPANAVTCEAVTFADLPYTVCEVTVGEDLRLFLRGRDNEVYGGFSAIENALGGPRLSFAMNAGMYHDDRRPVGLYIENGVQQTPASDGGGYGNYGLLPNGIFCIADNLRVWESASFAASKPTCQYATQSGPMLVINGALHPRFLPDSTSRYIRNGVGTNSDGSRAFFVLSERPVTFYQFGQFFRDHLGLPNALFLDGNVSRLHSRALGRSDNGVRLGPVLGVVD